ncbi:tRNA (adenosine(37)-N6)-dimethylallyltransferase MiaA [Urechidicola vernalis]|uniref:tRNA dimethylallyltransferase n=1 Tax=Urechidicola vernalis TaxID=3075600 RepID=A0ABU2Y1M9_9FLAO|nr:tRNA (adenosine(37)-N6)-dimethylallyltransferase MiaA [Urechidicola sp. P050]MDT0552065.1 tRNA (adenosine(37)-N6)-dimethylallyltransferase MiaA [Urechidicola sp. P050]
MPRKYLISVVGATAIGKTALSISLAKHYNAPIISCDSRQFFKEMNIGTAVPSKEELALAEHHFIQSRSIHDDYSVGQFEKDALAKLKELFKANEIVIMVGGSGLYVDAVLKGLDYFPKVDPSIRQELNTKIETEGIKSLQEQLKILDVDSYNSIEIENPHRLIRALEICIGTDKPYSYFKNKPKTPREFVPIKIGLTADRAIMYDRINQRVDIMINRGLLEEVKPLLSYKHLNALQTVGYRELFEYFEGKFTLDFAIEELKKNTRRFAKRQGTWFRKDKDIRWFDFQSDLKDIITFVDTRKQT